jgi:hypothetical protein
MEGGLTVQPGLARLSKSSWDNPRSGVASECRHGWLQLASQGK